MSMPTSLTDPFATDPPLPSPAPYALCIPASLKIYDPLSDSIIVDPFPIQVHAASIRRLLELPDQELLGLTSTSPDAEEERFVADVKSVYSYMLARSGIYGEEWLNNVFGEGRGTPLVFPRVAAK